jgi:peptidoglycan/LPS O-acetylase OafA/YrhL
MNSRTARKSNRGRIRGLATLRALAAVGVLLYHAFPNVIKGGYFGVITFFVISGYLSAAGLKKQIPEGKFDFLSYYKKRFLRIYPGLVIMMLSSIGVLAVIDFYRLANTPQEFLSVLLGYNNYWQIKMNASYFTNLTNTSPFTHLWYIAILIQFEVVWPLLAAAYMKIRENYGTGFALLAVLILTFVSFFVLPVRMLMEAEPNFTSLYYGTLSRVFSLLAGVMLGLMHAEGLHMTFLRFREESVPRILFALYILITLVLYIFASGTYGWVYAAGMQMYTILTVVMIEVLVLNRRALHFMTDDKLSSFIAEYSYGIYLWQYPVLFLSGIAGLADKWYAFPVQLAMIIILSVWMQKFLKPLTRGRKKAAVRQVSAAVQRV